jgi:arylsulfatase A-like enzyme
MLNATWPFVKTAGLGLASISFQMLGKPNGDVNAKPNIVIVLADDFGFGDAACYDPQFSKIPTPNIDQLANEGMRFTAAHSSSSVCTPTRYGLLTGRYNWRSTLQSGVLQALGAPLIASNRLTIAGMLKQQNYHTACIGKWHLGWNWPRNGSTVVYTQPIADGPVTRGFDYYFGTDVPNEQPYTFIENDNVTVLPTEIVPRDVAIASGVAVNGVMAPGWKFENILPTLAEKAVAYIDQRAQTGQPFFLYFPLTTPHQPFTPSERFKGKSGISAVGDLIMETDWALGEVMTALERNGLTENTLVIFCSDNGHNGSTIAPFTNAGHRVSGPFFGYKADIWEGGHRLPFVARWPGVVSPGSQCGQLISLVDVMATCAEVSGTQLPVNAAEDSISLVPLLRGEDRPIHEAVITHSNVGVFAIQHDNWKLIAANPARLYNVATDPAERTNVYAQQPAIVAELVTLLNKYVNDGRSTPGPQQTNDVPVVVVVN